MIDYLGWRHFLRSNAPLARLSFTTGGKVCQLLQSVDQMDILSDKFQPKQYMNSKTPRHGLRMDCFYEHVLYRLSNMYIIVILCQLITRICQTNHLQHVPVLLESLEDCPLDQLQFFILCSSHLYTPTFNNFWPEPICLGKGRAGKCATSK